MDNSLLTVYKSPFQKIRLGGPHNGGYVFADIPAIQYDVLLAGGIDRDILFEHEFVHKYNCSCLAYDGTIDSIDITNSLVTFVKKNISFYNNHASTNLHEEIESNQSIFIKMNIEGGEYEWIESLTSEHINKMDQIVIEFHHVTHKPNVLEKINQTHYLIHFHGNNCCGVIENNGIDIPTVFQCTYIHKKYITSPELNTDVIPGPLDSNDIEGDDIMIDYPPFVLKIEVPSEQIDNTSVEPVPSEQVDNTSVEPVPSEQIDNTSV